jgi:Flp pilus assembly protein TadG
MVNNSRSSRRRRGAAIVEFSIVFPVLIMLSLGTTVLSLAVSEFQLVATLAREGARYASVRGSEYQQTTGNSAATASSVYTNAILPKASGLTPGSISYNVVWSPNNQPGSTVTVTVGYVWTPSVYVGTIQMTSTSVMTIEY